FNDPPPTDNNTLSYTLPQPPALPIAATFTPCAPRPGAAPRRDNSLELRVKAALTNDLRVEQDLNRWFPLWGAPGL
ncbi:hypothetical protein ACFZCB_32335, partial [Streptomyces pseudovenezuelae]